jgi:hypothetical protein
VRGIPVNEVGASNLKVSTVLGIPGLLSFPLPSLPLIQIKGQNASPNPGASQVSLSRSNSTGGNFGKNLFFEFGDSLNSTLGVQPVTSSPQLTTNNPLVQGKQHGY